ncbi:glycoside hydrolase family 25 protein [Nocardioides stalactiti]|uniref:glycoside hydrolase family 25 protein n=1 Tax=Nocardioides stalactiti TaxID=2755356 RepID=UPI001602511A|nr:GH25 family lysozyme [Nocardioides stalactiti]
MRTVAVGTAGTALLLVLMGCSGEAGSGPDAAPTPPPSSPSASTSADTGTAAPPPAPSSTPDESLDESPPPGVVPGTKRRVRHLGIDASHHQGPIDWRQVAGDGITFAYLKATEGTTYADPTFADHRATALDHGLRVGGYHYFQLCSSGAEQAAHFVEVLGDQSAGNLLPPALDLELAGSCEVPPPRDVLLAEVRSFLDGVEEATGREPIVYLFPDFEARFGFAAELDDHRQWVRSLGVEPDRTWWVWQRTDQGTVAGIAGPVDVNVMWRRETVGR